MKKFFGSLSMIDLASIGLTGISIAVTILSGFVNERKQNEVIDEKAKEAAKNAVAELMTKEGS